MKYRRIILTACGACVALPLMIALAFDFAAGDPLGAAKARMVAEGWQEKDLAWPRFRTSGGLFGGTGQVEFQLPGSTPPKTIRVEMQRPMFSANWQVVAFEDSE